MTVDDAIVQDSHADGTIPGPRTTEPMDHLDDVVWLGRRPARRARPRSEYWDVERARWVTRPPVPGPRQG